MKKRHLILLIVLIFTSSLISAQHYTLKGKVLYLNSGSLPAGKLALTCTIKKLEWSKRIQTTETGDFKIKFPENAIKHKIQFTINQTDNQQLPFEIVNQAAINAFRVAKKNEGVFELFICTKEQRDNGTNRYLKNLNAYLNTSLKAKKAAIPDIGTLENGEEDYTAIEDLIDDIDALEAQLSDSAKVYKLALTLASIDRDRVTESVRQFLDELDKGTSLEEASKTLDPSKAVLEAKNGLLGFDMAVQEVELSAKIHEFTADYPKAISLIEKIIALHLELKKHPLTIANYRMILANYLEKNGDDILALKQYLIVIKIQEELLRPQDEALAKSYYYTAFCLHYLEEYETAITYYLKAIEIQEAISVENKSDLAMLYYNTGLSYQRTIQIEQAKSYYLKAINIFEAASPKHLSLVEVYGDLAYIYTAEKNMEQAKSLYLKAIANLENNHPSHHNLAIAYRNLGQYYRDIKGDKHKTLELYLKSAAVYEASLLPIHPKLALSYDFISTAYEDIGNTKQAITYALKELQISEIILGLHSIDLQMIYDNLARLYNTQEDYKNVLKYKLKEVKIMEGAPEYDTEQLASAYQNIARTYGLLKNYKQELAFHLKTKKALLSIYKPTHLKLGITYGNLAFSYTDLKQYDNALNAINQCINIFKQELPKDNPHLKQAQTMRGKILERKKKAAGN